jgi:hypothetical protein
LYDSPIIGQGTRIASLVTAELAMRIDSDGDGVDDADDVCNNTPPGTAVDTEGRPLGDVDRDCDTDLGDYGLFQQGMTGPLPAPAAGVRPSR